MTTDPLGTPPSAATACMRLVTGYQVSRAIYAAASLGLFDRLATPSTSDELAAAAKTHPPTTYRLLRALASVGLLVEAPGRMFTLTPTGQCLRSDAPGSLAPWALSIGRPYYWAAWEALPHSIESGESAFAHVHGTSSWDWRSTHPEDAAAFNLAMSAMSQRLSRAIVMAHDFGRYGCVVDVCGGSGTRIAMMLRRHPELRGVVFDLADAIAPAEAAFAAAGFAGRARAVGGSFFESIPGDGDAYVLSSVLHNWDDAQATAILRTCRRAMRPEARLLIVESDVGAPNQSPEVKFLDLNMLVIHGACERTRGEFEALLADAQLAYVGEARTAVGMSIIEARPV